MSRIKVSRFTKICPSCGGSFEVGGRDGSISKAYCSKACVLLGKQSRNYGWRKKSLDATEVPTELDIAWAAGIFEGEGWLTKLKAHTELVAVGQMIDKSDWLLTRLKALFGGSIYCSGREGKNKNYRAWHIHGGRAREFLAMVYPFLSPYRKEQIEMKLKISLEQT